MDTHVKTLFLICNLDWISGVPSSSKIPPIWEILQGYTCLMKEEKEGLTI